MLSLLAPLRLRRSPLVLAIPLAAALAGAASAGTGGALVFEQETFDLPSDARPAETPGTPGVTVSSPELLAHLGAGADLNRARYTRIRLDPEAVALPDPDPEAILILVPGFEGGASGFTILAQNLIRRALEDHGLAIEVWAFDRRSNQLEDLEGLDIAEQALDPEIGLDWLFGAELGLPLSPELVAGPNRRAVVYDAQGDVPFLANWTPLVFSRDIDAVVEEARIRSSYVFLGGHSAGTGFAARYAATDFDLTGEGPSQPGYAKLDGLVLLEGGGGSAGDPPSEAELDLVEARFDGGLFGAVRDDAPRCVDGVTACTVDTQEVDCQAFANPTCVEPTSAFAVIPGLLNPRVLSTLELIGLQMASGDPDSGISIVQQDFGSPGNNALDVVPDLAAVASLPTGTAQGALGTFIDDDGFIASLAFFVATSVGAPGPVENDVLTWLDVDEAVPASAFPDNGPAPSELPADVWGQESEPTRFDRLGEVFFRGRTNFTDWYYPSAGLAVTSGMGLDTSPLSLDPPLGRGRRDIDNRIRLAEIDIPVIGLGGSNGLAPVPASFLAFAQSIAPCTAPSCIGGPRVFSADLPNEAFPTFAGPAGGFEVHISEGYAHVDVLTAEDGPDNAVVEPISDFLARIVLPEPSGGGAAAAALGALLLLRRLRGRSR